MKIVINSCFGGFGLSEKAYERLIELGIPVQGYIEQKRGDNGLFLPEPRNEGHVIFSDELSNLQEGDIRHNVSRLTGSKYWDSWIKENRTHPLLVQVVEELGDAASGRLARLEVVDVPDGVDWEISDYDGLEHIAEKHRTWHGVRH